MKTQQWRINTYEEFKRWWYDTQMSDEVQYERHSYYSLDTEVELEKLCKEAYELHNN